jgi:uncharacterized protein (TIGR02594 family)
MIDKALAYIGLKEIPGQDDNPEIVKMFKDVGHEWVKDDETAWCAAFLGAVLERAGILSTRKLNARSYLFWGEQVHSPKMGDVVILWRVKPDSPYGHVGFFVCFRDQSIFLLGGNQNNQVSIQAYPLNRVLGYRTYKPES